MKDEKLKVNIIGAGVSGLSLGCYLQMSGFETKIFEKHSKPGGLCTSWQRGEYTFDGCIHWLLGSGKSSPFYKLWSELIDMNSIEFKNHELRMDIELLKHSNKYGNKIFHLYTNLDILEKYLTDIAPEDVKPIKRIIHIMRAMQRYDLPPMIESVPHLLPLRKKMGMIKILPFVIDFLKWKNTTNFSYARKFKNPFLREAFELLYDGEEVKLLIMIMPLAFNDMKAVGYPMGGSERFVRRMEEKYFLLGGKINYNTPVVKVLVENDTAKGIVLGDGALSKSDITISAADWHHTVFNILDGKYTNPVIEKLRAQKKLRVYSSVFLVSLGISRTFNEQSHYFRFPLVNDLVSPDGTIYKRFEVHTYNYEPGFAPEGKTVLTVSFYTDNGDFWIQLRKTNKDEYDKIKHEFAAKIIEILHEKIGKIKEHIEETDIATPATYHRYTNNWKGSVQGWYPGKNILASSPVKQELPGLKNFYLTSHWSVPGGGLPVVIKSSRDLVQILCEKYKKKGCVFLAERLKV